MSKVPEHVELQPLKWVLVIKTTTHKEPTTRLRSRPVSASHLSQLRFSVHGNAPTVMLSTARMLCAILPTWIQLSPDDRIIIFCRDTTKAFIQSLKSNRLIIYNPPPEFFDAYPHFMHHVWQTYVQIYGEVEAGLYWHKTIVPWLLTNIPDLQQSIFDPSMLYSPTKMIAILLCTDDTLVTMPESLVSSEATIEKQFESRDRQHLPTDFKGVDISADGHDIIVSQMAYIDKKGKDTDDPTTATKLDLHAS